MGGSVLESLAKRVRDTEKKLKDLARARSTSARRKGYAQLKKRTEEEADEISRIAKEESKQQQTSQQNARALYNKTMQNMQHLPLLAPDAAVAENQAGEIDQSLRYLSEGNLSRQKLMELSESLPQLLAYMVEQELPSQVLKKLREISFRKRPAGPRGTPAKAALAEPANGEFLKRLVQQLHSVKETVRRKEFALALGEWGGEAEAQVLHKHLLGNLDNTDKGFEQALLTGLTNIGGPTAVETLLDLAQNGSAEWPLWALSSLEFLSTGTPVALTEAPQPPLIDTSELRDAYEKLAERLIRLSSSPDTNEYIRYKAEELFRTIRLALRKT